MLPYSGDIAAAVVLAVRDAFCRACRGAHSRRYIFSLLMQVKEESNYEGVLRKTAKADKELYQTVLKEIKNRHVEKTRPSALFHRLGSIDVLKYASFASLEK